MSEDTTTQAHLAYITAETKAEARDLAARAIEARLAACANIQGPITSVFRWSDNGEDEVREEEEWILLLKTTAGCLDSLIDLVNTHHSYDCPCVVAWPISKGNPPFLRWISDETGDA